MTAIAIYDSKTKTGSMAATGNIHQAGNAFIASAGAISGSQFVEQLIEKNSGNLTWLFDEVDCDAHQFATNWREWCTARHQFRQGDEGRCYPSSFLILSPHGLFEIGQNGEASKLSPEVRCVAIGIGAPACMGAAHMAESCCVFEVPEITERAINAAIDLYDCCNGPAQACRMDAPKPVEVPVVDVNDLVKLIGCNNIDGALKLCNRTGGPLADACKPMLLRANRGANDIYEKHAAAVDELPECAADLAKVRDALLERSR